MAAAGNGLRAAKVEVDAVAEGRGQLARLHEGLRVVGAELEAQEEGLRYGGAMTNGGGKEGKKEGRREEARKEGKEGERKERKKRKKKRMKERK